MRSKPIAGRHLGWSDADLAIKTLRAFLNPDLQKSAGPHSSTRSIAVRSRSRCCRRLGAAAQSLFGEAAAIEDGFALTADGAMHVAARTDMPGVTPDRWSTGGSAGTATARNATSCGIHWRTCMPPGRLAASRRNARPRALCRAYVDRRRIYRQQPDPRGHPLCAPRSRWALPTQASTIRNKRPSCAHEPGLAISRSMSGYLAHHVRRTAGRQRDALALLDWRTLRGGPEQCGRHGHGAGSAAGDAADRSRRPRAVGALCRGNAAFGELSTGAFCGIPFTNLSLGGVCRRVASLSTAAGRRVVDFLHRRTTLS